MIVEIETLRRRISSHPIQHIQFDVLRILLEYAIEVEWTFSPITTPIILSQVCRSWEQILLGPDSGSLWSLIRIHRSDPDHLALLSLHLVLSRQASLYVYIQPELRMLESPRLLSKDVLNALRQHRHRIVASIRFKEILEFSTDQDLAHLSFRSEPGGFNPHVMEVATQIVDQSGMLYCSPALMMSPAHSSSFSALRRLSLADSYSNPFRPDPDVIAYVNGKFLPNLVHLSISMESTTSTSYGFMKAVDAPLLVCLHIAGIDVLGVWIKILDSALSRFRSLQDLRCEGSPISTRCND